MVGGRPVTQRLPAYNGIRDLIFPKESNTDWKPERRSPGHGPSSVLSLQRLSDKYPNAFDGYYAWVQRAKTVGARRQQHGEDY